MTWAVVLGLASAISYGITDYLARSAGQAAGIWRSLFYGELLAFTVLSLWLFIAAPTIDISWMGHAVAWLATLVSGIILLVSAAALTRAFMVGAIAVVAPLAASYGAISALLSAATGEHLGGKVLCGIFVTLAGVVVVSIPSGDRRAPDADTRSSGVGWALAGATGYGTGFWLRMGALLIDVVLIGVVLRLLHPLGHFHLIVLAAYGAIMWKTRGSTVGGMVFDLHVVR